MPSNDRLAKIVHFNLKTFRSVLGDHSARSMPSAVRDDLEYKLVRLWYCAKDAKAYAALPDQLASHINNVRDALRPLDDRTDLAALTSRLVGVCDEMRAAIEVE